MAGARDAGQGYRDSVSFNFDFARLADVLAAAAPQRQATDRQLECVCVDRRVCLPPCQRGAPPPPTSFLLRPTKRNVMSNMMSRSLPYLVVGVVVLQGRVCPLAEERLASRGWQEHVVATVGCKQAGGKEEEAAQGARKLPSLAHSCSMHTTRSKLRSTLAAGAPARSSAALWKVVGTQPSTA